jgi:hypothetical protein
MGCLKTRRVQDRCCGTFYRYHIRDGKMLNAVVKFSYRGNVVKFYLSVAVPIFSAGLCVCVGQSQYPQAEYPSSGVPRSQWLESHQGYSDRPDVIAHKRILKGSHLACTQLEHHPKHVNDGSACVLKFENGDKQTLPIQLETRAPADGEVYLECAGDKPTSCTIWWWRD